MKKMLQTWRAIAVLGGLLITSVSIFANPFFAPTNPNNVVTVSGSVTDECGNPVENAAVTMANQTTYTNANGEYVFTDIPVGTDLVICADYVGDPLAPYSNEVTICDIAAIVRHVTGISPLATIGRLLSADINSSGTVTTFDIVEMEKYYILQTPLPNGDIPPQYFVLPVGSANAPVASSGVSKCIIIDDIQSSVTDANFIRIAIGDTDGSGAVCTPAMPIPLQFTALNQSFSAGETIVAMMKPGTELINFQMSIYTPGMTVLTVTADAPFNAPNFETAGEYTHLVWYNNPNPEQPIIRITLKANVDGVLSDHLFIASEPSGNANIIPAVVQTESTCGNFEPSIIFSLVDTDGNNGVVTSIKTIPNPWTTQTTLSINTNTASEGQLLITDLMGTLVYDKMFSLMQGSNEIVIDASEIQAFGLLFYRLKTADGIWSGTMVKQ